MNLPDYADDGDLPDLSAKPEQPRDPQTQRFVKQEAPPAAPPTPPQQPAAPAHSPYFEITARQLGIPEADIASMTPAVLERVVGHLQAAQQKAAPKQAEPPVVAEAFDWGEDADGKPMTEEQARKFYSKPVFAAIKAAQKVEKLEKENAALKGSFEQDRQQRAQRQVLRQVNEVLATRPDLFGDKPGQAKPGSAEAHRYKMALQHIDGLLASQQATTPAADAEAALALFGPPAKGGKGQPKPAKSGTPTLEDYANGELAKPTLRRGGERMPLRDRLIEEKRQELIERGFAPVNGSYDDDSDLPD